MNIEWLKTALDAIGVTKKLTDVQPLVSRDGISSANSAFLNMLTPNDTSAAAANSLIIYNALQAAKARGGGEVVVPIFDNAGKIWVNAAAKVPAYCTLRGITQNATLYAASTFTDTRMVELGDTGDTQPPFCRVESLTLNAYGRGIWGVYSNKCQEGSGTSHVTAVQYGTGGGGFNFEDSGGLSPQNFILDDIYAYCNSAAVNTVAARFVGTGVSGRVNKVTVTSSGGSAQQADGIYVSAAWMALRDVHLEAHARGLTVSTGGRVVVDFIEGYDGGGGGAPRSVTKVISMYPDAGMCDLRGLAANGSYQLIDDQSVSPSYAVYGNGTTPGFGTAGSGLFKMNRYTNQPETMPKRTVANLPTGANVAAPARAYCSDLFGSSFVFGAVAVGGGSRVGPVFWDGSNWREG